MYSRSGNKPGSNKIRKAIMKLTDKQTKFLEALILANSEYKLENGFYSKAEPVYVETGKYKAHSNATIRSLIKKNLITAKDCYWSQYGGVQAWKQIWVTENARTLLNDKQIIKDHVLYMSKY